MKGLIITGSGDCFLRGIQVMEQEKSKAYQPVFVTEMTNEDMFSVVRIIYFIVIGICAIAAVYSVVAANNYGRQYIMNSVRPVLMFGFPCCSVVLCLLWKKSWTISLVHLGFTIILGIFFAVLTVDMTLMTYARLWGVDFEANRYAAMGAVTVFYYALIAGVILYAVLVILTLLAVKARKPVKQELLPQYNSIYPEQR